MITGISILAMIFWAVAVYYICSGTLFAFKVPIVVNNIAKTSPLLGTWGWSPLMTTLGLFTTALVVAITGFGLWFDFWWGLGLGMALMVLQIWLGCTFYISGDIKLYNALSDEEKSKYGDYSYRNEFYNTAVHIGLSAIIFGYFLCYITFFYKTINWWF